MGRCMYMCMLSLWNSPFTNFAIGHVVLFSKTCRSEKDASGWSQTKLKSLLVGLEFEGPEGSSQTVEVVSCKGEATAK